LPRVCVVLLGLLARCKQDATAQRPLTRVKAATAELVDFAPAITLTGIIVHPAHAPVPAGALRRLLSPQGTEVSLAYCGEMLASLMS
jgi:hypothetical protein